MTRRLLLTFGFPPALGGMQNYLYARCLAAEPSEITVLAPAVPGDRAFDQAQAFEVRRWPDWLAQVPGLGRVFQLGLPLFYALALYREKQFDLIECGQALPFGLIAWMFKRALGVPYLVWIYGREILKPQQYPVLRRILRAVLQEAALIISISESTRQAAIRIGVSPDRVQVIYPAVDTHRFHPDIDGAQVIARYELQGKKVVLTVSRLVPRKGIDTVIHALPNILEAVPDVAYVVVGDGPDRGRLKTLAQEQGVADHVHFVGWVNDDVLPTCYAACDVFVMVSRSIPEAGEVEGFGIVYLEAGACGKPVVAGRGGGVAEAVQDGISGLLVDPLDVAAVGDAVIRILQDSTLAAHLGAGGQRWAQRAPDWRILNLVKHERPVTSRVDPVLAEEPSHGSTNE